jgi:hypothetical protein
MTQIYAPSLGGWISGDVLANINLDGSGGSGNTSVALDTYPTYAPAKTTQTTATPKSTGLSLSSSIWNKSPTTTSRVTSGSTSSGYTVAKPTAPTVPSLPVVKLPTLSLPKFEMPERDEGRQRFLSDRAGRAASAKLSDALGRALSQSQGIENPVARSEYERRAMEGYGSGLADVLAAARTAGANEYNAERSEQLGEAQIQYQTDVNQATANWQVATAQAQAENQADVQKILMQFQIDTQTYVANLNDYLGQPLGSRGGDEVSGTANPKYVSPFWERQNSMAETLRGQGLIR